MRFRLAHLSDPHLGPIPRPGLRALLSKRAFGYVNWLKNRRSARGEAILAALVNDIAAQSPDHICVSGDLVNIALEAEFEAAARWLGALGPASAVSAVPGNHDAYVPGAAQRAAAAWAPHLSGDAGPGFPFCRRRGSLAIIGVTTAVATPPLWATGTVGASQRAALAALLDRHDDAFKVVMIHHPPDPSLSAGRRRLTDHEAVREVLAGGCADLVLHGHTHRPSLSYIDTARGRAAMVGVPSASSDGAHHPLASYALIDLHLKTREARLIRRGPAHPDGPVTVLESVVLDLGPGAAARAFGSA